MTNGTLVFAGESEQNSESVDEVINLNEVPFREVSEEKVISDYMRSNGVNRETAIKELNTSEGAQTTSNCSETWSEFNVAINISSTYTYNDRDRYHY